jgi:aldehyde:ferredoxin oxidoreductase
MTAVSLHPDTGFTLLRSHTHGWFGPYLKKCGYDGIILTGRAEKPVYLWITDDKVEIRDAARIWGNDSRDSEHLVREELGHPEASVAAIGPAGENMCAGASICNDANHMMSHGGAIMGSKNLKAMAVYGDIPLPAFDEDKHRELGRRWHRLMKDTSDSAFNNSGRAALAKGDFSRVKNKIGIASYNMRKNQFPEFMTGLSESKIAPKGCYKCVIACCYNVEITDGPYKGYKATMSGGMEALEGSSAMVGVSEPGTAIYLTSLYDRMGMDGSTAGCTISMAFEAFEKGIITTEDTGGLELKWGDVEVIEKVIKQYANREGFGDILARGPGEAAEVIGNGASDLAVHVKGTGINLHDWRGFWGMLLGNIVSSGAGWHSAGDEYKADYAAGFTETSSNSMTHEGKGETVAKGAVSKSMYDSIGVCWFGAWGLPGILEIGAESISAVTGWDYTPEELAAVGARTLALERCFNVRNGLTPEDDYNVPRRLVEAPVDGKAKGKSIEPYLRGMINEYYETLGWDRKTGRPYRSTLERLGMDDIADEVWG